VTSDLTRRRSLLTAALGFALLRRADGAAPPETEPLRRWLGNWTGVGHVVTGMIRQEYDLDPLRHDGRGWRAVFFESGTEHSLTSRAGTAWEPTPWRAVQVAAWDALTKRAGDDAEPTPAKDVILP
jgi:hypothetical protein